MRLPGSGRSEPRCFFRLTIHPTTEESRGCVRQSTRCSTNTSPLRHSMIIVASMQILVGRVPG